eukprot:Partr_v1_DN28443_c1_g1_i1_m42239 putative elongation of very long chain fatty acids protein
MIVDAFITLGYALEHRLDTWLAPVQAFIITQGRKHVPNVATAVHQFLRDKKSPLSDNLPLMNPLHVVALIVLYLIVVFTGKFVMASVVRQKLTLKTFSRVHNLFLVWLSAYMAWNVFNEAILNRRYSLFNNPRDEGPEAGQLAKFLWLFYFSKPFEFVDTLIMVAKMNFRQISFLHVYHHCSVFAVQWFIAYMGPSSEAYFCAVLNSLIHVVMYSYYLCTSLGVAGRLTRAVKPMITMAQMTQFCAMMTQATYNMVIWSRASEVERRKSYPVELSAMLWLYMVSMLALFANFFRKNYNAATSAAPSGDIKRRSGGKKVQ